MPNDELAICAEYLYVEGSESDCYEVLNQNAANGYVDTKDKVNESIHRESGKRHSSSHRGKQKFQDFKTAQYLDIKTLAKHIDNLT